MSSEEHVFLKSVSTVATKNWIGHQKYRCSSVLELEAASSLPQDQLRRKRPCKETLELGELKPSGKFGFTNENDVNKR